VDRTTVRLEGFALPVEMPEQDERPILELGVGTFFMVGGGAGSYIGMATFLADEIGDALFLRPSVAVGVSQATNLPSTFAAARFDLCVRLPGHYVRRSGMQLDLCGGADGGFSYLSSGRLSGTPPEGKLLPYVDLGPAVGLRAEVGALAVLLRVAGGVDLVRESFQDVNDTRVDAPAWSYRLELGLSWDLHEGSAGKSAATPKFGTR
jgi:hypothetical protein